MSAYRWDASDYARHSRMQQEWARELIGRLPLNGTEAVLDLGGGDGKVAAEIARIVNRGSVVGVDNSAAMIDLAQCNYPPAHASESIVSDDGCAIHHFFRVFRSGVL